MNSANGEKTKAIKQTLLPADSCSMKEASYDNEKQLPNTEITQTKSKKMFSLRNFFLALLLAALLAITIVSSSAVPSQAIVPSAEEQQAFRDLLNTVEPSCLHEVLHEHLKTKYKHGVFQEDKNALEAVHRQEPAVAFSLVELAKRQTSNSNGTTSSAPAVPSSTSNQITSATSSVSTDQITSTPTPTPTSPTSTPPTSTATDLSTSQPAKPTTSQTSSIPVQTSSTPSSTAGKSSTPISVDTTSSVPHSSATNTHSITTRIVYTTTEANGAVVTATSTTVVPAPEGDQTSPTGSASTDGATLQTGGAIKIGWESSVVLGAVVMVIMWTL